MTEFELSFEEKNRLLRRKLNKAILLFETIGETIESDKKGIIKRLKSRVEFLKEVSNRQIPSEIMKEDDYIRTHPGIFKIISSDEKDIVEKLLENEDIYIKKILKNKESLFSFSKFFSKK